MLWLKIFSLMRLIFACKTGIKLNWFSWTKSCHLIFFHHQPRSKVCRVIFRYEDELLIYFMYTVLVGMFNSTAPKITDWSKKKEKKTMLSILICCNYVKIEMSSIFVSFCFSKSYVLFIFRRVIALRSFKEGKDHFESFYPLFRISLFLFEEYFYRHNCHLFLLFSYRSYKTK